MTVMNSLPFSSKATLPCFVSHTTATPCKSSVRSQGGSCKCLAPPLSPGNCFHSPRELSPPGEEGSAPQHLTWTNSRLPEPAGEFLEGCVPVRSQNCLFCPCCSAQTIICFIALASSGPIRIIFYYFQLLTSLIT